MGGVSWARNVPSSPVLTIPPSALRSTRQATGPAHKLRRAVGRVRGQVETATGLPYRLEEMPGARQLLVFSPKLTPGGAVPSKQGRRFRDVDAHRLMLGADAFFFIGPHREERGRRAA